MTLKTQFEQELKQLGAGGETTLAVSEGVRKLICELTERSSLAVAFQTLRLTTAELADADASKLEQISKSLADRLNYLMEPICPIEIDADACIVQMRSSPPQQDDDSRSYYELVVRRGGELSLCRYRKKPGNVRERVPATITCEVLVRLAEDFSATLE